MAYTQQVWADSDSSKPLSAARMTVIENGINAAASTADGAATTASTANANASTAITNAATALSAATGKSSWDNMMTARMMLSAANSSTVRWPDGLGGAGLPATGSAWTATTPPPELYHYDSGDIPSGRSFEYRFSVRMIANTWPSAVTGQFGLVQLPTTPFVASPTTVASIPLPNLNGLHPMSPATSSITWSPGAGGTSVYNSPTFTWTPTNGTLWCLNHNMSFASSTNAFLLLNWSLQRRLA